jgi:hypothetical protein
MSVLPNEQLEAVDPTEMFCRRFGLSDYIAIVKGLLVRHFDVASPIAHRVHDDPELGESYLLFEFGVRGDVDKVLNGYDRFTDEWIRLAPEPVRDRIHVSFDVL